MIPALIAVTVAATAATIGVTVWSTEQQKKQTKDGVDKQSDWNYQSALVDYGTSLSSAPGSVPI